MLVNVKNLSISIPPHDDIVKKVSFTIEPNEIFAITGESGSGKSLTCLSLLRMHPKSEYPNGEIWFEGKNILELSIDEMQNLRGKEIAYISQEPALNPTITVYKQIEEVFSLHGLIAENEILSQTIEILSKVGLSEITPSTYPHELSGGQKQRVSIAIALALKPKLIIADEPTTSQDKISQIKILKLLLDFKESASVLLISHDFSIIKKLANRIAIMRNGKIVEIGTTKELLTKPKHAYTKLLIDSDPEGVAVESEYADGEVIFECKNLNFFYRRKKYIGPEDNFLGIYDINLKAYRGKTLGIIGESGAGKTTLAKLFVRLEKANFGQMIFNGINLAGLKEKEFRPFRSKIQLILQTFGLNPKHTVGEMIQEGLEIHRPYATQEKIIEIMEAVSLDKELLSRYPHQLSGGQRQRVAMARALVLEPDLLILDEPTSSLDRTIQKEILLLLKDLQKKLGLTYIFITHDLDVIRSIAHDVIILKSGQIVERGTTEEVFNNPKHMYTKNLLRG